jgi:uncharacterized protein YjbI with pentapeptide repeats
MEQIVKTTPQMNEIALRHGLWLRGDPTGVRANLHRANLTGTNLHRANLSKARGV